jgi:tetratricopeptide (TPR) repeat protein
VKLRSPQPASEARRIRTVYWRLTILALVATLLGVAYLSLLPAAEDPASLRNVGRSHYEEENYPEAARSFEEILKLLPDSAIDEINLGSSWCRWSATRKPVQHLERGEKLDPAMAPYAAYNLALSLQARARFREGGGTEFERVREMDPDCPDTAYNLAVVYENLGQLDKAFEEASRATDLLPDEIAPHYRRMMIAVRLGNTDLANQKRNRLTELRGQDARNRTPAELEMSRYTEIVEPERGKIAIGSLETFRCHLLGCDGCGRPGTPGGNTHRPVPSPMGVRER